MLSNVTVNDPEPPIKGVALLTSTTGWAASRMRGSNRPNTASKDLKCPKTRSSVTYEKYISI
jgi:hypothetical protein